MPSPPNCSANGEFFSSAPIAWKGLVFIGPAGSDVGIRGFVLALDAQTGEERWRFHTIPMVGGALAAIMMIRRGVDGHVVIGQQTAQAALLPSASKLGTPRP